MRVLVEVGEVCADYQDRVLRNLRSKRLQLDEMWCWIYCKEKNRTEEIARKHPDAGDVWLWVCIDADAKLVASWRLGQRDLATATAASWSEACFCDNFSSSASHAATL